MLISIKMPNEMMQDISTRAAELTLNYYWVALHYYFVVSQEQVSPFMKKQVKLLVLHAISGSLA